LQIYTSFDLLMDIAEVVKFDKPVIMLDYDELVLKVYYHRKKQVSLHTIMKKLRQLKRTGLVKMVTSYKCEYGICYSEKAKIVLYKPLISNIKKLATTPDQKPLQSLLKYIR